MKDTIFKHFLHRESQLGEMRQENLETITFGAARLNTYARMQLSRAGIFPSQKRCVAGTRALQVVTLGGLVSAEDFYFLGDKNEKRTNNAKFY